MGKDSLKIPQDIEACLYMDNLSQFETYINTSYIAGMSMIDDLLSELIKKTPPKTYDDSIKKHDRGSGGNENSEAKEIDW